MDKTSQSQSTSTEGDAVYQKWRHIPSPSSRGVKDTERSNRRRDAKKNDKPQQASGGGGGGGGGGAVSVGFSQSTTTSSGFKKQKQSSSACPSTAPRDYPPHDIDADTDDGKETNHDQSDEILPLPLPSLPAPREEEIRDGVQGEGDGNGENVDVNDNHNDDSESEHPARRSESTVSATNAIVSNENHQASSPSPPVGSVLSSALPNNSPNSNYNQLREERVHTSSALVGDMQVRVQQEQQQEQHQPLQDNEQDDDLIVARPVEDEDDSLYDEILIEDAIPDRHVKKRVWIAALVVGSIFIVILGITLGVTASNNKSTTTTTTTTITATAVPTLAPTSLPDMNQIALDFRQNLPEETWQTIQNNASSPQAMAYEWVTWESQPLLYGRDPVQRMTQRFALATLYYATGGETHWDHAPGWLNYSVSECDWWGCGCNISTTTTTSSNASKMDDSFSNQFTIRSVELRFTSGGSLRLSGTIPPEIGLLTNLEKLNIYSSPGLTGPIPTQLGLLSRLTYLSITSTDLTGTIPRDLVRLTLLETLTLSDNVRLGGSFMTDFGLLTNLRELGLGGTLLWGTIPTEIGRLANLGYLSLPQGTAMPDTKELYGTIPTELWLLTNFYKLDLSGNALTGTIPPELGLSLTNLEELYLDRNYFWGSLPTTLGLLSKLVTFAVSFNAITGSVPTELCNLVSLGLEFHVDCINVTCDCDCAC